MEKQGCFFAYFRVCNLQSRAIAKVDVVLMGWDLGIGTGISGISLGISLKG